MTLFCAAIWMYHTHDTDIWNVHRITYIRRTQESRNTKNTFDFLVQERNFLLPLSLKVFRHKERDTYSFYAVFFIFPTTTTITCGARSAQIRLASASPESRLFSFGPQDSTNWPPSKSPKSSARALPVDDVIHIPKSQFSIWGFLFWHLWTTHPPHARVNTCAHVCT